MTPFTLIVNPANVPLVDVEVGDLGVVIPTAGGLEFADRDEIQKAIESLDLRGDADAVGLLTDDVNGAGSSTLLLQVGAVTVPQADLAAYLDTATLPTSGAYGVLIRDAAGVVTDPISFSGATLTGAVLGGDLDAAGNKIVNLGAPTADDDAATKAYVDAIAQGLNVRGSVRALADAPIVLSGTQAVDGIALAAGERVLVTGQADPVDNGIYVVAAGAWARAADLDTGDQARTAFTFVQEGTTYADTGWVCTSDQGADVVGTNPLTWAQFSGAGQIVAGAGLTKAGSMIDVGAGDGIIANADDVAVDFGVGVVGLGGANAPGVSTQVARVDHVHAHGDRSGDGGTQHTGSQVAIAGTYAALNTPTDVEDLAAKLDALLAGGISGARDLQYGERGRVPNNSQIRYLSGPGDVSTADVPTRMKRAGSITGLSIQVDRTDPSRAYELVIEIDGVQQVVAGQTLALPTGQLGAQVTAFATPITYTAGQTLAVGVRRTSGSGRSRFRAISAAVEVTDT